MDTKTMRAAVLANRGGWESATDEEIARLWASLDEATKRTYLESVKPAEALALPATAGIPAEPLALPTTQK